MLRVKLVDMPQHTSEIGFRRVDDQVIVTIHQATGVYLDTETLRNGFQQREKILFVAIGFESPVPARTTVHHVVPRAFEFYTEKLCHGGGVRWLT